MILRSIRLENIRSYTNHEFEFPEGSTLLSGDIGAGKSSILLAIEFALFGIRRKHLDGGSLLRHGKNNGSVELKFSVEGKEIIIKRNIKRGKNKIEQDSGYMIVEGIKKAATAIELKTIILDILGYPKELVTRSKDLVYRYTVYTPQEEMKNILTEDSEIRLDTLRKVFGIDKYKRIGENTFIVIRSIKEKRKELAGKISDLETKKRQKEESIEEERSIENKIKEIGPLLEDAKKELIARREDIEFIEESIKEYNSLRRKIDVINLEEKNKHDEFRRLKEDITRTEERITQLKENIKGKDNIDKEDIKKNILIKEKDIETIEKKINEINIKLHRSMIEEQNAGRIKQDILKISKCPTCEQDVSKEYKDFITRRENEKIIDAKKNTEEFSEKKGLAEKELTKSKKELKDLKDYESRISLIELKKKEIEEKERLKLRYEEERMNIKKRIGEIFVKKKELEENISRLKNVQEEYNKVKKDLDETLRKEREIAIEKRTFEEKINGIRERIKIFEKDISEKEDAKRRYQHIGEILEWMEGNFIRLTALMERQVMLNIHSEFNELFKRWFGILMEDETISVNLDDSFNPIIEQNGYETNVSNLSGGEKTAAALAYRLSLNKVVNDLMGNIKTKDIIILDEPTDGFSTEQLDKVRDVLDQIGVKQTIIVSHETKIESFVDNVIRINKDEHISKAMI